MNKTSSQSPDSNTPGDAKPAGEGVLTEPKSGASAHTSPKPEPSRAQIKRWRRYLAEERLEADTYRDLARRRGGADHEILAELARAEERHEQYWLKLLGDHAYPVPRPGLRVRLLNSFAKMFGSVFILAMMQRAEDRSEYADDVDAPAEMAADEQIHGEVVRALAAKSRSKMSGTFRAAVFGANDGLVSNVALILGMVGASSNRTVILAAGLSGLLAGALSMAAGEYVSVRSQRELLEASNPDPHTEEAVHQLDVNANELALVYRARGMSAEDAAERAQAVLAQGNLVNEDANAEFQEVGEGAKAAWSSFGFFATGAIIPLLPFLLPLSLWVCTLIAVGLVGIALFITGSIVGILSGANPLPRGLRQLAIGYGAAAATYGLGWLFGTIA